MQQVSRAEKEKVSKLLQVMERFRELDPEMSIQGIITFLQVAKEQGGNITALANAADLKKNTATRNVQAWTALDRHKKAGHDMIAYSVDPRVSRRDKIITLTRKGRTFLTKLLKPL
jgi:DNA-binding MarR family transcriptional regulator